MFGRKKRLLEQQSQLYRQVGQELAREGQAKIGSGTYHIGVSMFTDGGIGEIVHGFKGGRNIADGVSKIKQSFDCHQAANILEEEAKNTPFWHLW